jgi:PAS domain S-box-containing protein
MNFEPLLALKEVGSLFPTTALAATGLLGFFLYRQSHQRARAEAQLDQREIESLHRRLKIYEQRYGAIFNRSGEGILVAIAKDLAIVEANPAARRMAGIAPEDSLPALTDVCQMALDANETAPANAYEWFSLIHRHRRLSFLRKDGSALTVEADAAPIEHEGRPAYQFFLREVTDRTELEQQLRHAQKLATVGQMVCGIAHELCNPLAVVNGYAEILLERPNLDPEVGAQLKKVKHEATRASKLVKNFLSYSHQKPVRREPMSLNEAVDRALEISSLQLRDVCAETILHFDADLPKAIADADQVQQIIVNLIHNSLQAMHDCKRAPRLTFTTLALDEKIVLKIEDNGPGIPKHLAARIFEPFFTTKPAGVGTGLGLSIAHNIMSEHKGRIYYKPAAGGGAGFVLEFPRASIEVGTDQQQSTPITPQAPSPAKSRELNSKSKPKPATARRILILDDQDTIAELLGEMIRLIGHEPFAENDPQRALERLEEEDFDIILSDYRMPNMNGQEFYHAATALKPELTDRIIFLTGDLMNEDTANFLESSGVPYLRKPFHLDKIESAIATALKKSQPVPTS